MIKRNKVKMVRILPVLLALCLVTGSLPAQNSYSVIVPLMSQEKELRQQAVETVVRLKDMSLIPGIVDAIFFTPKTARKELVSVLEALTGEKLGADYYAWVEYVGKRSDIRPGPGYAEWKVSLLSRIDPNYEKVLYPNVFTRIRLEEIVWGGVKLDGIPTLQLPQRILASEAKYLKDDEKVFGISIGPDHRAYPLRILSWHEMLNDVVAGEPITLSY